MLAHCGQPCGRHSLVCGLVERALGARGRKSSQRSVGLPSACHKILFLARGSRTLLLRQYTGWEVSSCTSPRSNSCLHELIQDVSRASNTNLVGRLQGTGFIARCNAEAPRIARRAQGGVSLLAGSKARGGSLSPVGAVSQPQGYWPVGGLRASGWSRVRSGGVCPTARVRFSEGRSQPLVLSTGSETHAFHERARQSERRGRGSTGSKLLCVLHQRPRRLR